MTDTDLQMLLDEYRAEVAALRTALQRVKRNRKRTVALIETRIVDGHARWIITAPTHGEERLIADAVGEHISKDVGNALRLVNVIFTGSSRKEEDQIPQ